MKTLELSSLPDNMIRKCRLKSAWYNTSVAIGQIVYIKAKLEEDDCYNIDDSYGYICLFPDTLISGTTVVGSLYCRRKGVLNHKFGQLEGSNNSVRMNLQFNKILLTVYSVDVDWDFGSRPLANHD